MQNLGILDFGILISGILNFGIPTFGFSILYLLILEFKICNFVILQFCYFAGLWIAVVQFVLYFVFISIYILLRSMGGNTPKGIYKHNISYFLAPVNKYSLFSLDLQIQTLDLFSLDVIPNAEFGHDLKFICWGAMS